MCRHQYFRCAELVRCPHNLVPHVFGQDNLTDFCGACNEGVSHLGIILSIGNATLKKQGGGVVHSLTPTLPLSMRLIRESIRECCHSVHITTAAGIEQRKKPTRVFALCCCEGQQELLRNSFQFVCFLRASVKTMGSKTGGHGLCCCLLSLSPVVLLFLPSTSCVVVDVELCLV